MLQQFQKILCWLHLAVQNRTVFGLPPCLFCFVEALNVEFTTPVIPAQAGMTI
jgi:hypothetical protein